MRLDLDLAGEKADGLGQAGDGDDLDAFDDGRLGRAFGRARAARAGPWLASAAAMAIDSAPLVGRVVPSRASSPTTAYSCEPLGRDLPAAGQDAQRDRQIERGGLLGQIGRGQVDDDAVLRPLEAGVDHRPLDAVRAFLDRRLRQADENVLRQARGRDIDLDLDRQGVDADEREGFEFGEHKSQLIALNDAGF